MPSYSFPARDPADISEHRFDWSKFLGSGETVTSATVTAEPTGLTISEPVIAGSVVTVVISGGVTGSTYEVNCRIETSLGLTFERGADLSVENL